MILRYRKIFAISLISTFLISCNSGGSNLKQAPSGIQKVNNSLNTSISLGVLNNVPKQAKYLRQNKVTQPTNPNGNCGSLTPVPLPGGEFLQTTCHGQYRLGLREPWHDSGHSLVGGLAIPVGSGSGYTGVLYDGVGNFGVLRTKAQTPNWNEIPAEAVQAIRGVATGNGIICVITSNSIHEYRSGRWYSISLEEPGQFLSIVFSPINYQYYLLVHDADQGIYEIYSYGIDGVFWPEAELPGPGPYNTITIDGNGNYHAFFNSENPSSGDSMIATSTDAKNWIIQDSSTTQSIVSIATGNGTEIGIGQYGDVINYSGGKWSKITNISTDFPNFEAQSLIDLNESNGTKSFILMGDLGGIPLTLSSKDGMVWTNTEIPRFSYMKAGDNSVCALESATTRSIYCWGDNESGQLGFGKSGGIIPLPKATTLSNLISAQLAVGGNHACALTVDGHFQSGAYCWGNNSSGQLGNGTYNSTSTPTQITLRKSMTSLIRIYSGNAFNCATDSNQQVWCWGSNAYGQLGRDPESNPNSPIPVNIRNVSAITSADHFALGDNHACAVTSQNQLYCWGDNSSGQLGLGESIIYATVPTLVKIGASNLPVAKVYAGGDNTCAIAVNGSGFCWGNDSTGQVGNGRVTAKVSLPDLVMGNFKFKELHPSSLHTCGITTQYDGLCWGDNAYGELGDGKTSKVPQNTPYTIIGKEKWMNMTTGYGFTCATDFYEGRNYCWGKNDLGAIGINSNEPLEPMPYSINSY